MTTLFSENYEKLLKFIFNLYDFDKDGLICREDIRIVLSYIPLNTENFKNTFSKFLSNQFKDRIESQDELHSLLEKCFKLNEFLDLKKFTFAIENISSDIFLFILIFLMEKKPFSKNYLEDFDLKNTSVNIPKSPTSYLKLIASPNLQSKFSPSITISKSPSVQSRTLFSQGSSRLGGNLNPGLDGNQVDSKNFLLKFAGGNKAPQTTNIGEGNVTLNYGNSKKGRFNFFLF